MYTPRAPYLSVLLGEFVLGGLQFLAEGVPLGQQLPPAPLAVAAALVGRAHLLLLHLAVGHELELLLIGGSLGW